MIYVCDCHNEECDVREWGANEGEEPQRHFFCRVSGDGESEVSAHPLTDS